MLLTMKTTKIFWTGIFCAVLFCGCRQSSKINSEATAIAFNNYQPQPIEVGNYFSCIKAVSLEINENSTFSYVAQLELRDTLLFVSDNDKLCLFNTDGKFISKIGRQGRGPGEYVVLKGFFIDDNNAAVSIIDDSAGKIITYGFDGKYLSSKEIPGELFSWGYYAMLADNNNVLIFNQHNPTHNMAYSLMNIKRPERVEYFNTYEPVKLDGYSYHFARHPMARSGNNIHLTMPLDNTIYEYSRGDIYPKYYIETPKEIIPKDRILFAGPENSYLSQLLELISEGYFGGFTDIFETDDSIFLHYWDNMAYPGLYVMDKTTNRGEYLLYPSLIDALKFPVFPFSASDGNTLVSLVSANHVTMLKTYLNEANDVNDDLRKALDSINESSNPLLVVYKMKR
jgi:hypothetical protein